MYRPLRGTATRTDPARWAPAAVIMGFWCFRRQYSHDHGNLSRVATENSPGSWNPGPRAALRICLAMPHRRYSRDHQILPGRRPRATVTPGPDAPAGTPGPARVCRDGSHHDVLASVAVGPITTDRSPSARLSDLA